MSRRQHILTSTLDYNPTLGRNELSDTPNIRSPEYYLDIDGRKVVYFLSKWEDMTTVVVPGVVVSEVYPVGETKSRKAVDVEPIKDTKFKSKVTERLKNQGNLTFW